MKPLKSKEKIVALLVEEYNENSKFYNMKVVDEKDNNEENNNEDTTEEKSDIEKENNVVNNNVEEKQDNKVNGQAVIAESNNKATNTTEDSSVTNTEEDNIMNISQEPISNNFFSNIESIILQRVNEERAKEGLAALTYSSTMRKYARIKSMDMGDRGYFEHRDPEGRLMSDIIKKDGITYKAWGENIAYIGGMTDEAAIAERFVNNWMNSPSHKANILCDKFGEIGIGVYKIGNRFYATQEFFK